MSAEVAETVRREVRVRTIVINDTVQLAPWADMLYSSDAEWWAYRREWAEAFAGLKVSCDPATVQCPDVAKLKATGTTGFDPDPGASTTGYGYAEADPVNYADPTGAYSWWEFARNVLAVVSITAAAMTPGAQWYVVLAISLASSGGQLAITAAERDAQGLELTTTDWVFEGVSVAMDMAFVGSGKGVKSAWQSKKAVTESVDTVSEELTSSALRMSSQPANEAPSLFREAAKATLIVAGFQVVLGGGGSEEQAASSGAGGQDQGGSDPQDCPVEGGCEGMPSREGEHRGPDRL